MRHALIHRDVSRRLMLMLAIACGGCAGSAPQDASPASASGRELDALPTTVPAPVTRVEQRDLPARAQSLPVKQGTAPLAYLVETDTSVRIVDLDANRTLVTTAAEAGSPLVIDQQRGIRIGRREIVAGPLPEGRRYGIFLDTDNRGYYRTGVTEPPRRND